jgi:hypothetical protein
LTNPQEFDYPDKPESHDISRTNLCEPGAQRRCRRAAGNARWAGGSAHRAAVAGAGAGGAAYLRRLRLKKGDRCALLAHNSMQWVAMDLAIMAEGLTVVPLYARQAPSELVAMMKDCWPAVIACGEKSLADAIVEAWPEAPPHFCFENVFTPGANRWRIRSCGCRRRCRDHHLHVGHVGRGQGRDVERGQRRHMLGCTSGRLDQLMKKARRGRTPCFITCRFALRVRGS